MIDVMTSQPSFAESIVMTDSRDGQLKPSKHKT